MYLYYKSSLNCFWCGCLNQSKFNSRCSAYIGICHCESNHICHMWHQNLVLMVPYAILTWSQTGIFEIYSSADFKWGIKSQNLLTTTTNCSTRINLSVLLQNMQIWGKTYMICIVQFFQHPTVESKDFNTLLVDGTHQIHCCVSVQPLSYVNRSPLVPGNKQLAELHLLRPAIEWESTTLQSGQQLSNEINIYHLSHWT